MSTSAAGRVRGEDRQRQRRADAVGAEQHLERRPLVAAAGSRTASGRPRGCGGGRRGTPVDVGSSSAERARRDGDEVADAADLEEHRARRRRARARSPRSEPIIAGLRCDGGRRGARIGAMARWHRASAAASAASAGCGRRGEAEPGLHHLLHLRLVGARRSRRRPPSPGSGVYCTTSQPAAAASARASPLACPTLIAVRTLTWKNTCSTATTSGRNSAISAASSALQRGQPLRQRVGRAACGCTPSATARAPSAPGAVEHGVAAAGEPGVDAQHRGSDGCVTNTGIGP